MTRLEQYIQEKDLKTAKILQSELSTKTVDAAATAFNCKPEDIVKSIILEIKHFNTDSRDFYLVILQGNKRVKTSKVKKVLKAKDARLASPEQVLTVSGYQIGDVPPISIKLPVIIDEGVLERQMVYAGGGAPNRLIYISVEEILACNDPQIADISSSLI